MALIQVNFYSNVLRMSTEITVILPQQEQGIGMVGSQSTQPYPVLWLLHGMSDDHTTWLRRTSIERYVSDLGLAVVMPNAHLSFYENMKNGVPYRTYLTEELPAFLATLFPLSQKREDQFVAGLSMGGYGALLLGLHRPDFYAAIGCFSSGNLVYHTPSLEDNATNNSYLRCNWGVACIEDLIGTEADIDVLATRVVEEKKPLPAIYHVCGSEDFLLQSAHHTRDFFTNSPFAYHYVEARGAHEWSFWDFWVQDFLVWLDPFLTEQKQ